MKIIDYCYDYELMMGVNARVCFKIGLEEPVFLFIYLRYKMHNRVFYVILSAAFWMDTWMMVDLRILIIFCGRTLLLPCW